MNSSVIGKIEKAKRYAQERNRMRFTSLSVNFHGENADHTVSLEGEKWRCTCDFFAGYGVCAHTMALERVLEGMLPATASSQLLQRA
ncbi:MAG TPA: SWIM zinc finger family protein [Dehalococcoidia bacterium]